MLIQLTYASRTSRLISSADMRDILQASQRNNAKLGITGALCMHNGTFLQQLEGDRAAVNLLYHRILKDPRHKDPAVLDFGEIASRRFGGWSMGMLSALEENKLLFLKYSRTAEFDPYRMGVATLREFFGEMIQNVRWINNEPAP
jgi:Sensors of blue-light using FAD